MPQAVRREIVSHDGRFRGNCAVYHLRAYVEIKRLLERAPHLLHGRFGVRLAGGRLRKKIAATLFLDLCQRSRAVFTRTEYCLPL